MEEVENELNEWIDKSLSETLQSNKRTGAKIYLITGKKWRTNMNLGSATKSTIWTASFFQQMYCKGNFLQEFYFLE